jgi:2-polyprenyl-3-methyl-5-hydroxy-6-metoxy-1,4-benzoquinol methylase
MGINEQARELRRIWSGFQQARVLLTANNYRVFDHLRSERTAGWLSRRIGTDRRATEILLDALTALGLLRKRDGKYRNTPMAMRFLVSDSPYYQGNIIRHVDVLWRNWSGLDDVMKNGVPSQKAQDFDSFIRGMHDIARLKADRVIGMLELKGIERALDLGGGPGTYAMEMAKRGIEVVLFDRPEAIKIARRLVAESGVEGVEYMEGDFMSDDIGHGYDLILVSQILHAYSDRECIRIIRKCRRALNPSGVIAIQEFLINEQRTAPLQSALFSVNMLVNTEAGRCYTPREMKGWLRGSGFTRIKVKPLEDAVLIEGRKG